MNSKEFRQFLEDNLTYQTTEHLTESIMDLIGSDADKENLTQYDRVLFMVRTAFIMGAEMTQNGEILKIAESPQLINRHLSQAN